MAATHQPVPESVTPSPGAINSPVLLPDSRCRVERNVVSHLGRNWAPGYCANCGKPGGFFDTASNFAFYLCNPCSEMLPPIEGTYSVPDAVFWAQAQQEQLEQYGRELNPIELVEVLKDDSNSLTKLCKDRQDFNRIKMS